MRVPGPDDNIGPLVTRRLTLGFSRHEAFGLIGIAVGTPRVRIDSRCYGETKVQRQVAENQSSMNGRYRGTS